MAHVSTGGDLALTITDGVVSVALSNPNGDVVATLPLNGDDAGAGITSWASFDEYGNLTSTAPANTGVNTYGWHGKSQRALDASGLILMGVRLYNSATGAFTSRDPIDGGNTTTYAYPQDPINQHDLDGKWRKKVNRWGNRLAKVGRGVKRAWGGAKKAWDYTYARRRTIARGAIYVGAGIAMGACAAATAGVCAGLGAVAVSAAIGGAASAATYRVTTSKRSWRGYGAAIGKGALGGAVGGGIGNYYRSATSTTRFFSNFGRNSRLSNARHAAEAKRHWGLGTRWAK